MRGTKRKIKRRKTLKRTLFKSGQYEITGKFSAIRLFEGIESPMLILRLGINRKLGPFIYFIGFFFLSCLFVRLLLEKDELLKICKLIGVVKYKKNLFSLLCVLILLQTVGTQLRLSFLLLNITHTHTHTHTHTSVFVSKRAL